MQRVSEEEGPAGPRIFDGLSYLTQGIEMHSVNF